MKNGKWNKEKLSPLFVNLTIGDFNIRDNN